MKEKDVLRLSENFSDEFISSMKNESLSKIMAAPELKEFLPDEKLILAIIIKNGGEMVDEEVQAAYNEEMAKVNTFSIN